MQVPACNLGGMAHFLMTKHFDFLLARMDGSRGSTQWALKWEVSSFRRSTTKLNSYFNLCHGEWNIKKNPGFVFPQVWCVQLRGDSMGTSDIEIAMERNEPNASSRSGWFPESEAGDTKGTWSCGGKDHLGMLANVSCENKTQNT